ncbi:hypothetical protein [Variovorax sp. PAMC 28711]|uniref:hypothetical protein n=1 Tax=Variovorax sp. PAMC 28711 TaxID=1795631 RepID=UPI00078D74F1|nr:hypothetical protein [Variovorax sp. PAMC 28711]AMM23011.1 hypothetical protein AX767_00405 [Variovorax sp. PAMC 28711]
MKRDWFPTNGRALLEQRRKGLMPASAVNVNLDVAARDELCFVGHVLTVAPHMPIERMNWRMLANLAVWIWADDSVPIERLVQVAYDIVAVKPAALFVRFVDPKGFVHDVDCGSGIHEPGYPEHGIEPDHDFIFCTLNLAGTRLGFEVSRALRRAQPKAA